MIEQEALPPFHLQYREREDGRKWHTKPELFESRNLPSHLYSLSAKLTEGIIYK